jgi:hypothetical protein
MISSGITDNMIKIISYSTETGIISILSEINFSYYVRFISYFDTTILLGCK